jgi:hypothetical protein
MDMSFYVPTSNTQYIGDENHNSAQVTHRATRSTLICEILTTEIFSFLFSFLGDVGGNIGRDRWLEFF